MKKILHGLYNGKIIPWERRDPHRQEQLEIAREIDHEERYFIDKMSFDDCQRFQKLSLLYSDSNVTDNENAFSYGFTLGLLLAFDIIDEAELISNE